MRAVVVGSLVAIALTLSFGGRSVADDAAVRDLIEKGRAAFDANHPDEAVVPLRMATQKESGSAAAWAWLGQALEKNADRPAAIDAFRAATGALAARRKAGTATPDDVAIVAKACERLEALVPGEGEMRRLSDRYVAELLSLARDKATADAPTAKRAVDAVLAVAPDDAGANELARSLGLTAGGGGAPASSPGRAIANWDDLLAREAFDAEKGVSYVEGRLRHEAKETGEIVWAARQPEVATRFVLEMDARLVDRTRVNWHAGWAFYEHDRSFASCRLHDREVTLVLRDGEEWKDIEKVDITPPKDADGPRRLSVSVDGRSVTATYDGKKLFTRSLPDSWDTSGRVGVWTQYATIEYRTLKAGTP